MRMLSSARTVFLILSGVKGVLPADTKNTLTNKQQLTSSPHFQSSLGTSSSTKNKSVDPSKNDTTLLERDYKASKKLYLILRYMFYLYDRRVLSKLEGLSDTTWEYIVDMERGFVENIGRDVRDIMDPAVDKLIQYHSGMKILRILKRHIRKKMRASTFNELFCNVFKETYMKGANLIRKFIVFFSFIFRVSGSQRRPGKESSCDTKTKGNSSNGGTRHNVVRRSSNKPLSGLNSDYLLVFDNKHSGLKMMECLAWIYSEEVCLQPSFLTFFLSIIMGCKSIMGQEPTREEIHREFSKVAKPFTLKLGKKVAALPEEFGDENVLSYTPGYDSKIISSSSSKVSRSGRVETKLDILKNNGDGCKRCLILDISLAFIDDNQPEVSAILRVEYLCWLLRKLEYTDILIVEFERYVWFKYAPSELILKTGSLETSAPVRVKLIIKHPFRACGLLPRSLLINSYLRKSNSEFFSIAFSLLSEDCISDGDYTDEGESYSTLRRMIQFLDN